MGVPSADAAVTTYSFAGNSYGAKVSVGTVVKSGPFATATLGCSTVPDRVSSNNTEKITLANGSSVLGTTGTTVDTVKSAIVDGRYVTTADSDVQFVNIDGILSADVLHAKAKAFSGPLATSGDTTFVNLKILGVPYGGSAGPNTKIDLGPLGYVVLNEQISTVNAKSATMTVNAIHVRLLNTKTPLTPVDIIVGSATAKVEGPTAGVMEGYAFGTNVNVLSGVIRSGRTFQVTLPCRGTNDSVLTSSAASLALPSLLNTGTIASTAKGKITDAQSTATMNNTIQGVNLAGRIKADVIKTEISGVRAAGGTQVLSDNSVFVGLTIDGTPYGGTPAANTKIVLPGLGTLWLHRVVVLDNGLTEIRSIELILSAATGGLPIGTSVRVGVAALSIHE